MYVAVVPLKRLPGSFQYFTYAWEETLGACAPGLLVMAPWRSRIVLAVVWRLDAALPEGMNAQKIKTVLRVVHPLPFLTNAQIAMIETISALYKVSLSAAAAIFLPPLQITKLRRARMTAFPAPRQTAWHAFLRPRLFAHASDSLMARYMHIARRNARSRAQTLIVFPYRAMAEKWLAQCGARLRDHVIWYDGSLSPKERFNAWMAIKNNPRAVVIGAHLSLCAPLDRLRTIIVADEHARAHKQWDSAPRYHNRDMAIALSRSTGAELILASPTPSMESLYASERQEYILEESPAPSSTQAPHTLIDLKNEFIKKNFSLVSDYLWEETESALRAGKSVFYLLNRRGWGSVLGCRDCGFVSRCSICAMPYVYHEARKELQCHHCRVRIPVLLKCPNCSGVNLYIHGAGTEKLHAEITARMRAADLRAPLIELHKDAAALTEKIPVPPFLIIGTSVALPYLSGERLAVVCVINADRELARPEFRSQEEQFQEWWNLGQMCDSFIIQTSAPESPLLNDLSLHRYRAWYEREIEVRRRFTYPPFCAILKLIVEHAEQTTARRMSMEYVARLRQETRAMQSVAVSDPVAYTPPVVRGRWRFAIIIKLPRANSAAQAARILALMPDACKADYNPYSLFSD